MTMFPRRTLVLLAAALVATVAVGTAYAFSSGNHTPEANEHTRTQEDDEAGDAQADDGLSAPDKAELIADAFGASPDAVLALQEQGIGWGALFKLHAFARAKGVSVDELVAAAPTDANGEKDFAFGEMKESLTPEQLASFEEGPKNFGQLVSSSRKKSKSGTP